MTAATACRTCGAEPLENARFCHRCGSPVAEPGTHAEYKQVTVLFADVVRSMAIAAAVDMERLREIVTELVERSAAVVRRYGGTVEFTGDGVMAVFGAPAALEDHAVRACLAALAIQEETNRLAAEVARRDGVALRVRVGLNSGEVIAGEVGSGSLGYIAIGEQVGMAQRMESVAPPGGVMLSASTARLVDGAAALGEPEWVRIKGADEPVMARRLVAVGPQPTQMGLRGTTLVGREWELNTVASMLDRSISGHGCVVDVTGPPGIGKSRLIYEATALARRRGAQVFSTFCESHTREIPFHVVARLLRDVAGIADVDDEMARQLVRAQVPGGSDEDVLLLNDLLGIRDPKVASHRRCK
jgi:class 3 adenylate cyclase